MSGINISYEIANAGGEIAYFEESSLNKKEPPNLANVIAGEIVNEILENAINIATQANDTGVHWKQIKEPHNTSSMKTPLILKSGKVDTASSDVVDEIIHCHTQTSSTANIGEIIESLNKISVNQDAPRDKQDVETLDVEMKKLLTEMLSSPFEIVNYTSFPVKGGVGDQPNDDKSECLIEEPLAEPEIARTVEKKSRVTDLIKNSPQIISEYLMMDKNLKQNQEEWEESEERLLQVIELDCVRPGEEMFKVKKPFMPEHIALPLDDDEEELIQMPVDDVMDVVDLSSEAFRNEENQLLCMDGTGAKGDEHKRNNIFSVIPSNETATSGEKIVTNLSSFTQKEIDEKSKDPNPKEAKFKKNKKWNIGTKLWGFLKKGHKQSERD